MEAGGRHRKLRVPQKCVFEDLCRCHTKRRMGRHSPANPSFGMTPSMPYNSTIPWHRLYHKICKGYRLQIYSLCHTKRRIGGDPPAYASFGMTTTRSIHSRLCSTSLKNLSVKGRKNIKWSPCHDAIFYLFHLLQMPSGLHIILKLIQAVGRKWAVFLMGDNS